MSKARDLADVPAGGGDLNVDSGTLFVDASANSVGIGTDSPSAELHIEDSSSSCVLRIISEATSSSQILMGDDGFGARGRLVYNNSDDSLQFWGANSTTSAERMRIDSSGSLLVGTTSTSSDEDGVRIRGDAVGLVAITRNGNRPLLITRRTSDGDIVEFRKDTTTVGSIGSLSGTGISLVSTTGSAQWGSSDTGLNANGAGNYILPWNVGANTSNDNAIDLGASTHRFDDIYATNGTIQTSDRNEKQDIASLTTAEMAVAARLANQFKTFRWIDSVTEKGENARTHTGVIAQDVQQAFADEGLDAGDYALFISTTWWETQTDVPAVEAVEAQDAVYDEEGNLVSEAVEAVEAKDAYTRTDTYDTADEAPEGATERTRMGIRYPQLLSFMQAYNDQRMTSIEARLDALEAN